MPIPRILLAAAVLGTVLAGSATASAAPPPPTCRSLEHCYPKSRMDAFLGQAGALVQEFSAAAYGPLPAPGYVLIPSGRATTACDERLDDQSYLYCTADRTVYVGQESLWTIYSEDGDAAAVAGLAHEWGHHVQLAVGVDAPVLVREVQADCIAGAWLAYERRAGQLEPGDLTDVGRLVRRIASAETPDRDHGTLTERAAAFNLGLDGGLPACSRFSPATPIG